MTRFSLLSAGLVALIGLSGCTAVEAQRYPTSHRGGTVYQPAPRPVDYRPDRARASQRSISQRRVERDVRRYVNRLDRELRLDRRQERRIREALERRTYRLLRNTRPNRVHRVYPFPRRLGQRYFDNRAIARFWQSADGRVEQELDRYQRREFRYLTGQLRHRPTRARDGRDRYRDDDWYRDRRRNDDRDDRRRGRDRDDD